jgi:hypothetical protein
MGPKLIKTLQLFRLRSRPLLDDRVTFEPSGSPVVYQSLPNELANLGDWPASPLKNLVVSCHPDQGSFFWLQNMAGLTLVGVFMEGTTLTC